MTTPFGTRLRAAMAAHGPLCAGIDPHGPLLHAWDLDDDAAGLETFTMRCVEAFAGEVACVKPQSAFFERHGAAGIAVLERAVAALRESGTLCLLDAKRGDIGSTMAGYAHAYLAADAPLRVDAMTVSPYLGYGSLQPLLDVAADSGAGVFVLALTSNPEGRAGQHARTDSGAGGGTVAGDIVAGVRASNAAAAAAGQLGSVGMVVGATVGSAVADLGLDLAGAHAPLLAPGVGAQGASAADLRSVFGAAVGNVVPASSRDVLTAGPDVAALRRRARDVGAGLRDALRSGP